MAKKSKTKLQNRILLIGYLKDNIEFKTEEFIEPLLKKDIDIDILIQSFSKDKLYAETKEAPNYTIVQNIAHHLQEEKGLKLNNYEKVVLIDLNKIKDVNQIETNAIFHSSYNLDSSYVTHKYTNRKKINNDILILSPKIFEYIIEANIPSPEEPLETVSHILSRLNIESQETTLTKQNQEKTKKNILKHYTRNLLFWFFWYFKLPFQELKTKPHKKYDFLKISSFYRTLFQILILFIFIALPIISLSVGNSGDEEAWQYPQSQRIIKFYTSFGKDKSYKNVEANFHTYGNSFDTISSVIINIFKIKNVYEARHIMNSLVGCFLILIVGLMVKQITDWRGGLIAILLMLLSPRFLGHSLNNPKDIPFAFGYIFSIYYFIRFFIEFPKIKLKTIILASLGIGISLSVRAGGLMLIPYLIMFGAAYFFFKVVIQKQKISNPRKYFLAIISICFLGYLFGIPLWPFALENPIKHPVEALSVLTKFSVGIRQLFDGQILWSDNVPSNYLPKYYFITTPIIVLTGLVLFLTFLKKWNNTLKLFLVFVLLFSFIFPVSYIIYKKSNVYGAIRHTIFIYPMLVTTAAVGINNFLYKFKTITAKLITVIFLASISLHPLIHIIKNKPVFYVYFNQFIGGVKGAYGKYELDYYFHSLKKASNWFIENELPEAKKDTLTIATNFNISYYFRDYNDKIKTSYVRYYDRGNSDWDYAIIANTYINPEQLKKNTWPPENTIHTLDVDGVPVCAILKRNNKLDLEGYQKLKKRDFFGAIQDLSKSIELEKTNEAAYMNLATAYMYIRQFDKAKETIQKLLEIYPKYDKGLNLLGLVYYNQKNYEEAYKIFTSITELNPKFVSAYHNLGLVFLRMNKKNDALKYFQKAIKTNRKYKPPYLAIANILKEAGKEKEAQKYIDAANKLK